MASELAVPLLSCRFCCAWGLPRLLATWHSWTDLAVPARIRPGFLGRQEATRVEEDLCSEMGGRAPGVRAEEVHVAVCAYGSPAHRGIEEQGGIWVECLHPVWEPGGCRQQALSEVGQWFPVAVWL